MQSAATNANEEHGSKCVSKYCAYSGNNRDGRWVSSWPNLAHQEILQKLVDIKM